MTNLIDITGRAISKEFLTRILGEIKKLDPRLIAASPEQKKLIDNLDPDKFSDEDKESVEKLKRISMTLEEIDKMPIPKRLFFVAIGKKINKDFLENISQISGEAFRKGLEVEIIVENKIDFLRSIQNSSVDESEALKRVRLVDMEEVISGIGDFEFMAEGGIHDTRKVRDVLSEFVKKQQIGLKNIAVISDVLRYAYLAQKGGYYMDWDVKIIPSEDKEIETGYGFKTWGIAQNKIGIQCGNDILGSVPNHPILIDALSKIAEEYYFSKQDEFYTNKFYPRRGYSMVDAPVSEERKKLVKSGYKYSEDDARRSYDSAGNFEKTPRFVFNMNLTGPGVLAGSLQNYVKTKYGIWPDKLSSANKLLFFPGLIKPDSKNPELIITINKVFGSKIISHSAGEWAIKPKNPIKYFDDSEIKHKPSSKISSPVLDEVVIAHGGAGRE